MAIASRLLWLTALVATVAVAVILLLADRHGSYDVSAVLVDAGQLVKGNEVQIGGERVGTVSNIQLLDSGRAKLSLKLHHGVGPLPRGTSLTIRLTSQSGSASRYVVLTPGDPNGPKIPNGGRIDTVDTTSPVDFDALLDTLDAPTRQGLRDFLKGSAEQYGTNAARARATLRNTAPAFSTSVSVLREFASDRRALDRLITQGAISARAVASRSTQLTDLISNTNTTAAAIGDESVALQRSLALLPETFRKGSRTLADLRPALDDLQTLVDTSKPATKRLALLLSRLRPLLSQSVPTVHDLALLLSQPGAANDLVDLVQGLPALQRISAVSDPNTVKALNRTQDMIDAYREYTPDIAAAVARVDEVSSYYDANGHYIRAAPSLLAYGYDAADNQLTDEPDHDRLAGLNLHAGARCPGSATATAPADGSAPLKVPGCTVTTP